MTELFLCSQSPRRRFLLENAGYKFHTLTVKVSEIPNENLNIKEQICDIATRKARAGEEQHNLLKLESNLILTADTVVVFENQIFGKPADFDQAFDMLSRLSGQTHEVITACCLKSSQKEDTFFEVSRVTFKSLEPAEIRRYIETGEPMDKAGSYGIQDLGRDLVAEYEGSFSNIMGLPMERLQSELADRGVLVES